MKNFSFLGCVVNIILFVVYVFVTMLIAGIIYWAISGGQTDSSTLDKIGYLSILIVLIVTLVFRKFFYRSVFTEKQEVKVVEEKKSYTATVKENAGKQAKSKMKIYVDKEIK